jgi:hypothetical protein
MSLQVRFPYPTNWGKGCWEWNPGLLIEKARFSARSQTLFQEALEEAVDSPGIDSIDYGPQSLNRPAREPGKKPSTVNAAQLAPFGTISFRGSHENEHLKSRIKHRRCGRITQFFSESLQSDLPLHASLVPFVEQPHPNQPESAVLVLCAGR